MRRGAAGPGAAPRLAVIVLLLGLLCVCCSAPRTAAAAALTLPRTPQALTPAALAAAQPHRTRPRKTDDTADLTQRVSGWAATLWRSVFGGDSSVPADTPRELDAALLNFKATGVLTMVKGLYISGMLSMKDFEKAQDVIAANP